MFSLKKPFINHSLVLCRIPGKTKAKVSLCLSNCQCGSGK